MLQSSLWQLDHLRRSASQCGINDGNNRSSMSLRSTSNYSLKISTCVSLLNGGMAIVHNFLTSIVSHVTFCAFQVCIFPWPLPNYHSTTHINSSGSAVAIEHIFSGSWDTISLQQASLQPETIYTLMLVKHCLHLRRNSVVQFDWSYHLLVHTT